MATTRHQIAMTPRALALVLLTLVFVTESHGADPVRLRVLSYNIHHGEGIDGRVDLERIADTIVAARADLVALQEVDCVVRRSGSVDQPAELARLTGMHVAFGGNIELQGGRYGNMVLSRYPIVDHENHLLPRFDDGEQRGVLVVRTKVPGLSEPLLFLATHFDHRSKDRERMASAKAIDDLFPGDPVALLAGDLNDDAASATIQLLERKWSRTNRDPLATVPVDHPTRQIDFILYRPSDRWKVLKTRTLEEAVASDHRAILAELAFQPD